MLYITYQIKQQTRTEIR